MTDILLISHEGFASGARKAAELIVGEQENLHCHELTAERGIEFFKNELKQKISYLISTTSQLIIISDLKSGTPYNVALSVIVEMNAWQKTVLFSGMNLNLLLEVLMMADENLTEENQREIMDVSRQGIFLMDQKVWEQSGDDDDEE